MRLSVLGLIMGLYAAAYELGLNALMVHYCVRYNWRFPWDASPNARGAVVDALRRLEESVGVLDAETPRDASAVHAVIQQLKVLLAQGLPAPTRGATRRAEQLEALIRPWGPLATTLRRALRVRPRLYPWYRLGRAVAFCYLDLADAVDRPANGAEPWLPHLAALVQTAACLPQARLEALPLLQRLAAQAVTPGSVDPCARLAEVLGEDLTGFHRTHPHVAVIDQVQRLEVAIGQALQALPDGPILELRLDADQPTALLRGEPYLISYHQGRILRQVLDAEGGWVTSAAMAVKDASLRSANIKREVDRLPRAIQNHLQRHKGHGGGYRWVE